MKKQKLKLEEWEASGSAAADRGEANPITKAHLQLVVSATNLLYCNSVHIITGHRDCLCALNS